MEKKLAKIVLAFLFAFVYQVPARADIIQLDLLSLGCPTEFNSNFNWWQTNFDLGVTFTQISHVYINWSGTITAGLWQSLNPVTHQPVGDPFAVNEGAYADFGIGQFSRQAVVEGGATSYPVAETFNLQSEVISRPPPTIWSDLLGGKGTCGIGYNAAFPVLGNAVILEGGSITLNSATIVVEGTVIPEPGTFAILSFALPIFRAFLRRKK